VKWLERVTVRTEPSENYFQATAYRLLPADVDPSAAGPGQGASLGSVALNSAVLRPTSGATLPAGPTEISGYAYAGDDRSVARVDVSPDGGTSWVQAELVEQPGPWAWCLWRTMLELAVGEVDLVVRAWDTTGAAQPESPAHLWNPKGYINNSWDRHRLNIR
jgi:sulfite oxidase